MLPDSGRTTTEMRESRTMVLCFDGTTNQYSAKVYAIRLDYALDVDHAL